MIRPPFPFYTIYGHNLIPSDKQSFKNDTSKVKLSIGTLSFRSVHLFDECSKVRPPHAPTKHFCYE